MRRPKDTRRRAPDDPVPLELVNRCRSGDDSAWEELVRATYRDVYTLCLRILRDPDDAAEATQDAYLRAFRGLRGFRGEAMFSTWLYRVATNAAVSKQRARARRRRRETGTEEEALLQIAAAGSTEAQATARLDVGALERALSRLPEHHRSAVVLRDVYGLSTEEIAQVLKISQTAAKVRVHRGRKRLRDMMYGDEDEDREQER